MKPYLTIDIETTGLDPQYNKILQLAAVWDDGKSDINKLSFIDILINYENDGMMNLLHSNYAMGLNGWIFKALAEKDPRGKSLDNARHTFLKFCTLVSPKEKITVAGKNAAGFDLPFLKHEGFATDDFSHRVLDVGSLYAPDFGYVPSLDEINKLLGGLPVKHNALSDCRDVVYAVRKKMAR